MESAAGRTSARLLAHEKRQSDCIWCCIRFFTLSWTEACDTLTKPILCHIMKATGPTKADAHSALCGHKCGKEVSVAQH
eukprot:129923-Amphidinium_carterae.1